MTAYRDQYASLFNGGRNVVLMGISTDSQEELGSWLRDEDFPFLFASDETSASYQAFGGGTRGNGMVDSRAVIVVGPDGRIAYTDEAFNQNDPMAYEQLGEVIDRVTPEPEGG